MGISPALPRVQWVTRAESIHRWNAGWMWAKKVLLFQGETPGFPGIVGHPPAACVGSAGVVLLVREVRSLAVVSGYSNY